MSADGRFGGVRAAYDVGPEDGLRRPAPGWESSGRGVGGDVFGGGGGGGGFGDLIASSLGGGSAAARVLRDYDRESGEVERRVTGRPSWRGFFRALVQGLASGGEITDWRDVAAAVGGAALSQLPGRWFDRARAEYERDLERRLLLEKYAPKLELASLQDEAGDRVLRRALEAERILQRDRALGAQMERERLRSEVRREVELMRNERSAEAIRLARDRLSEASRRADEMLQLRQRQLERRAASDAEAAELARRRLELDARSKAIRSRIDALKALDAAIENRRTLLLNRAAEEGVDEITRGVTNQFGLSRPMTAEEIRSYLKAKAAKLQEGDATLQEYQTKYRQLLQEVESDVQDLDEADAGVSGGAGRRAGDRPLPPPRGRGGVGFGGRRAFVSPSGVVDSGRGGSGDGGGRLRRLK